MIGYKNWIWILRISACAMAVLLSGALASCSDQKEKSQLYTLFPISEEVRNFHFSLPGGMYELSIRAYADQNSMSNLIYLDRPAVSGLVELSLFEGENLKVESEGEEVVFSVEGGDVDRFKASCKLTEKRDNSAYYYLVLKPVW